MGKQTAIVIVDDHPVFRKGLKDIIEPVPQFRIVGEAENGEVALRLIDELRPDIAIVDIEMPTRNGFDLVKEVHARQIPVDIVFLTMYKEEDIFNAAMDLGIKGYVLKECAVHDILECIRVVTSGKYYISPLLSTHLIHRNDRQKEFQNKHAALTLLTATERKILKLIAENKTSKEIAEELFISYKTVENHRNNIANKLNLHGAHQLLKFALENKSYL
jgi:DNA-binding NarL/FixJ family response regulator